MSRNGLRANSRLFRFSRVLRKWTSRDGAGNRTLLNIIEESSLLSLEVDEDRRVKNMAHTKSSENICHPLDIVELDECPL